MIREVEGQTIQWPKKNRTKGQTTIYKTLSRKLKIEELEPNKNGCLGRVRIHEFTLPPKCDSPQSRKIGLHHVI
jgi:hypothetical protein